MSERLAGEIRSALGHMNDDAEPVVLLVRDLVEQLAELEVDKIYLHNIQAELVKQRDELEQQLTELRRVRDDSEFMTHLKCEAERVASWPEWKRKL